MVIILTIYFLAPQLTGSNQSSLAPNDNHAHAQQPLPTLPETAAQETAQSIAQAITDIEKETALITSVLNLATNPAATDTGGSSNSAASTGVCAWPDAILTSKSGNDLSVIVDKKHCLPSTYAPGDLVDVGTTGVYKTKSSMLVRQVITADMKALVNAMHSAGINISVISCYRSYSVQQSVYANWVKTLGQTQADRVSARPGHSEHQLGTVCDFSTSEISHALSSSFAGTAAGKWMQAHAPEYGFKMSYPEGEESVTGYSWEPWHWRYWGK